MLAEYIHNVCLTIPIKIYYLNTCMGIVHTYVHTVQYMCICLSVTTDVPKAHAQHMMGYLPFAMQMTALMIAIAATPMVTGTTVHSTITSTSSVLVRSGPGDSGGRVSGGEWEKGTGCR